MKLDTVPGGLQEMEVREWAIKSEEWQERGGEGLTSTPLISHCGTGLQFSNIYYIFHLYGDKCYNI